MKDIKKLKDMNYSLLCDYEEIPIKGKGWSTAFEAYPNPLFHVTYSIKNAQIPLGLCGGFSGWCSKYEDITSYKDRVKYVLRGCDPDRFFYDQKFFVCMYNPNCESQKFEDAISFVPAFIVHDIKGFTSDNEENELIEKSLKRFHLTHFGKYYDGMPCSSKDLYKYSYMRRDQAKECYSNSLSTSIDRAEMISQVLNKYDIKTQSVFAQDVLTRLYENTFIMLNKAVEKTEKQLKDEGLYKNESLLSKPKLKKPKLTDKIFSSILSGKDAKKQEESISLSSYMEFCEQRLAMLEKGKQEMLEYKRQKEDLDKQEKENAEKEDRKKRIENFKL